MSSYEDRKEFDRPGVEPTEEELYDQLVEELEEDLQNSLDYQKEVSNYSKREVLLKLLAKYPLYDFLSTQNPDDNFVAFGKLRIGDDGKMLLELPDWAKDKITANGALKYKECELTIIPKKVC